MSRTVDETITWNANAPSAPLSIARPVEYISLIQFHHNGNVIRIDHDGRIFWKGREVETDADFREAMKELAQVLVGRQG